MSIVCAAIKNDEIAIAADTQMSSGSLVATADDLKNCEKLFKVNDNVIGYVGWKAMSTMLENIMIEKSDIFMMDSRQAIYKSLMKLHQVMKDDYYLETSEHSDQPVESLQLDAMVINQSGLYVIGSYREVNQYKRFWAIGSGYRYSLGAMEVLYEKATSAKELVESGVYAAIKFDDGCSLPISCEVIQLASKQRIVMVS